MAPGWGCRPLHTQPAEPSVAPSPAPGGRDSPWEPRSWFFIPASPEAVQEELSAAGRGPPGPFEPPCPCPESPTLHCPLPVALHLTLRKREPLDRGPSLSLPPNPNSHTAICPISCYKCRRGLLSKADPCLRPWATPPACSGPGCCMDPLSWPPSRADLKASSMPPSARPRLDSQWIHGLSKLTFAPLFRSDTPL